MNEQLSFTSENLLLSEIKVEEENGELITTSINVAHVFGKRHADVLRAIDQSKMSNDFRERNFALGYFTDSNGDKHRKYKMNRDGWSLLVMGFTGEKAIKFKEGYIAKFNEMEKTLVTITDPPLLPNFNDPVAAARAWADAKEAELKAKQNLIEAKPKIEFYDQVGDSEGLHTVAEAAKILGTGRNRLFSWMRNFKILRSNNLPYQQFINSGYFKVKESPNNKHIYAQTFVTPTGLQYLQKRRENSFVEVAEWAKNNNIDLK